MSPPNSFSLVGKINNEKEFDLRINNNELPIVLVFMNPWSGHSFLLIDSLHKLVNQYKGKFQLLTVDIDKNPSLKKRFFITKTPTTCFFQGGKLIEKLKGILPNQELETHIKSMTKLAI